VDRRAVSEVVGYALIVGIVSVTVIALQVGAMTVQQDVQDQMTAEAEQRDFQRIEGGFGAIDHGDNRTSVSVRTETANAIEVVRSGAVTVVVNDRCQLTKPLSSVRYEKDGDVVAYESGGIFRVTDAGVAVSSSPDLSYENGTVDLTIKNLTGETDSAMTFVKNVTSSKNQTRRTDDVLFAGKCAQPHNVTVSVTSDFADGWERYVREEFPPTAGVTRSGNTVNVTLEQSHLPEAANISRNQVVNFSNTSQYGTDPSVPSAWIDKPDDSNVYHTRLVPVHQGVQMTEIGDESVSALRNRKGLDVVLVIDESGSMYDNGRIWPAKAAAKSFVGELNATIGDRVGLVGYDDHSYMYRINGRSLSSSFDDVNDTIDSNFDHYSFTAMNEGLYTMNLIYDFKSSYSQKKYAILLADGHNACDHEIDDCSERELDTETKQFAQMADESGIKIFTVGYANSESQVDEELMRYVASATGGEYFFTSNEGELEKIFENIADTIVERKQIVYDPGSMGLAAGGSTFKPYIPGATDHIANVSGWHNINDPTAPARFSFTITLEDGEPLNLSAYRMECDRWETTGSAKRHNGTEYYVTRCAEVKDDPDSIETIHPSRFVTFSNESTMADVERELDDSRWYQANLSTVMAPYVNNTTGDLTLAENQAILAVQYSDQQRMILLLEVGQASYENDLTHVVDVQVDDVRIQEKDEKNS
jgi:Mg-chelatase subunit ChlD